MNEYDAYLNQLDQMQLPTQQPQLPPGMASTMFNSEMSDNLVKWQLDIKEELERIEHLLRKHVPKTDEEGNIYYEKPDASLQLFNEKGINEILNLLAWYLNKNIILSDFNPDEIDVRVKQFGEELADFIFNNYEDFGMDNKEKIKHFPMVHMNIVNTVEAAYHRAKYGRELESLRTARTVHQTEQPGMMPQLPAYSPQPQQKKSIVKPWTWGR